MTGRLYLILFLFTQLCLGQVGINTTDPQQALHIAHSDTWPFLGKMRVESLDYTNNVYNGGDVNADGNVGNDLFPLYVDENGDFTLEFEPLMNSEDIDALNDTNLPTSTVYLAPTDINGYETTNIVTYTIAVNRAALLEVKYNISFDVYLDPLETKITDNLARKINTYIDFSGISRNYGYAGTCYSSGSTNSITGNLYTSSTAYIPIPSAGTYDITIVGVVASNIKAASTGGNLSESTYVEFATGDDFVFLRLH